MLKAFNHAKSCSAVQGYLQRLKLDTFRRYIQVGQVEQYCLMFELRDALLIEVPNLSSNHNSL